MGSHIGFFYGTLKRGYGNNERCLAQAKFLGKAISVEANYIMQEIGFPIIWQNNLSPKKGQVTGELFEITDKMLADCDRLEGHPNMYKREEREFALTGRKGGTITAWVYLWQGPKEEGYGDPVPLVNGQYTWDLARRRKHALESED
jgi:gamma-glutamylaminecyclotransferase